MRIHRIIPAGLLLATLAACGGQGELSPEEKKQQLDAYRVEAAALKLKIEQLEKELAASGKDAQADLRPVTVLQVKPITFQHFVEVPANVVSEKDVMVSAEMVGGRLLKRLVSEGTSVKRGQRLALLDTEVSNKQAEEIESALALARTLYEKQDRLWKQKIGSEVQYLQAKNQVEQLEARLASVKATVGKNVIVSPIDGVVDQYMLKEGELAAPGVPFIRVVNLSSVEVEADVSEAYGNSVRKGDKVLVSFPMVGEERSLPVLAVGQSINPSNRTFRIRMKMDNPGGALRPNTMAIVKLKDYERAATLSVPSNLVQKNAEGETFLYIVEQQQGKSLVRKVGVQAGRSYDGLTEILQGLSPDALVVDKGYSEVVNGQSVRVVADTSETAQR